METTAPAERARPSLYVLVSPREAVRRLALAASLCLAVTAGCQRKPNVLLVSIDSLRADHVGAYGYPRATTPTLDRLAASGARFRTAVSSTSWTLPAHVSLFTALPDAVHGVRRPVQALDEKVPTLAEAFSAAGYQTVGFFSGPFLHPLFGFARGFDAYVDCTAYAAGTSSKEPPVKGVRAVSRLHRASHRDVTNPRILSRVSARLDQLGRGPFFFFVHMWDVHYDYIPPPPYDRMFDPNYQGTITGRDFRENRAFRAGMPEADRAHIVALYDGEIRYTDDTLAAILGELKTRGMLDHTIVVVTSDHGDEFLDHGGKGHRATLFNEVIEIPLIVSFPGRVAPAVIDDVVSIIDIAPTLLELTGLPPMSNVVGRSLAGLLLGHRETWQPREALAELDAPPHPPMFAILAPTRKLIRVSTGRQPSFYDLLADPEERRPIHDRDDPRVRALEEKLDRRLREYEALRRARGEAGVALIDPETREELRSLGYLD